MVCALQMNIIAGGFYDGVMLYAQVLTETMATAGDRPGGKMLNGRMWNRTFHGEFRNRRRAGRGWVCGLGCVCVWVGVCVCVWV